MHSCGQKPGSAKNMLKRSQRFIVFKLKAFWKGGGCGASAASEKGVYSVYRLFLSLFEEASLKLFKSV